MTQHKQQAFEDYENSAAYMAPIETPVPRINKAACMVAVLSVCVLAAFIWFFISLLTHNEATAAPQNISTPQNEWQQGVVPTLYQTDAQWADHPYGAAAFKESGCGPICLTMAYVAVTGDTSILPTDMADFATAGGYADAAGTSWSFMLEGAQELGLNAQEFILSEEMLNNFLSLGMPVICIMGEGDFTTTGHFIVIASVDEQGNYSVRDSNSVERTQQSWSFEQLYSQHLGAWVYW